MKKVLIAILVILLVALIGTGGYILNLLDRIPKTSLKDPDTGEKIGEGLNKKEALGIGDDALSQKDTGVTNILLFGLDNRSETEKGHSDAILIASVDRKSKKIKLTSLMRDMYVKIPGREKNRINTAYFSGGPSLAIKTVNTNFNMNIEDYITVNFKALEDIINLVGGVDIDIKKNEVKAVSPYIDELNKINKGPRAKHLTSPGLQTLSGRQAVAYARVRSVGRDDFERTERQRRVMSELLRKGMKISVTRIPELVNTVLPNVETSLTKKEIIGLTATIVGFGNPDMAQFRIPTDDGFKNEKVGKMMVLVPDLEKNTDALHEFIYGSKSAYASEHTGDIGK